jgi:hypothetical protein
MAESKDGGVSGEPKKQHRWWSWSMLGVAVVMLASTSIVSPSGAAQPGGHSGASSESSNVKQDGTVFAGFADTTVTIRLDDFNCVEHQNFESFTTKSWAERHSFDMDTITSASGCGVRPSWVRWELTVKGPGWTGHGKIWFGQDGAAGKYYAKCVDFSGISCIPITQTGLELTLAPCNNRVVNPNDECGVKSGESYLVNAAPREDRYTVINVWPGDFKVNDSWNVGIGEAWSGRAPGQFYIDGGAAVVKGVSR